MGGFMQQHAPQIGGAIGTGAGALLGGPAGAGIGGSLGASAGGMFVGGNGVQNMAQQPNDVTMQQRNAQIMMLRALLQSVQQSAQQQTAPQPPIGQPIQMESRG